ncbi:uncharacterized protein TNCT_563781 [Trichonephila clavata]|uniref:Apolipoprotein L3 n=1 Tax=Trichonephila clavata TaxID=2740835 RepID=A0A8X6M3Y6_TRICU|nr:uncharacterized protein TNCT_563781 [Trichonephila clavata]
MKDHTLLKDVLGSSLVLLLDDDELELATTTYDVAFDEVQKKNGDGDTDSVLSFEEKVEATKENFDRVVDLFSKANKARNEFLKNFDDWDPRRCQTVEGLIEIADKIDLNKFNGCISKITGGSVGAVGGILVGVSLFCPPLAAVTLPLAIGGGVASVLGGGVVVGTTGTEIVLLRNKLNKAKALITEEEENFSCLKHWFIHNEALMKAIEDLVGHDLLQEMLEDVKKFFKEVEDNTDKYNQKLMELLETCVGKMCCSKYIIKKFDSEISPIVMTFVFVICLMSGRNRIILDCALLTQRLALGLMSALGISVQTGRFVAGLVMKGGAEAGKAVPAAVARVVGFGVFVALGIAMDVVNVVHSSIDLHKGAKSSHAKEVRHIADLLKEEHSFLQNVHKEMKSRNEK